MRLQSCLRSQCPDTRSSQWWTYPGRAHTTWPKRTRAKFSAQVLDVCLCSVNAYQSKARGIFTKGFRPTATGRHHFLHIEGTKRYFLHETSHRSSSQFNGARSVLLAGQPAIDSGIEEVSRLSQLSGDLSGDAPRHHVELRARPEKGTANAKGVPIGEGSGAVVSS